MPSKALQTNLPELPTDNLDHIFDVMARCPVDEERTLSYGKGYPKIFLTRLYDNHIVASISNREEHPKYKDVFVAYIKETTSRQVVSFLGEGATVKDLVVDVVDSSIKKQRFPLDFGLYFSTVMNRKELEELCRLATCEKKTSLWFRQMDDLLMSDILLLSKKYKNESRAGLAGKILAATKKMGRPPIPGRLFYPEFPDEIQTGKPVNVRLFKKDLLLFDEVKTEDGEKIVLTGIKKTPFVTVYGSATARSIPVGLEKTLLDHKDNPFANIHNIQYDVNKTFSNLSSMVDDRQKILDRAFYFFCANNSYDLFARKEKLFGGRSELRLGIFLEGVLSHGKFDLNQPAQQMILAIFEKTLFPKVRIDDVYTPSGHKKTFVVQAGRQHYVLGVFDKDCSVRLFTERFVLAGLNGITKKNVEKILMQEEKTKKRIGEKGYNREH